MINCAAKHSRYYVDEAPSLDDAKSMFDTNYWGSVYCAYYALPHIKKSQGNIVAICSILGKIVSPGNSFYCSSKFALSAFFESLRIELRKDKIGVILVYPGYLKERMQDSQEHMSVLKRIIAKYFGITAKKCAERIIKDIYIKKESDIFPLYAKATVCLSVLFPKLVNFAVKLLNKNSAGT